MKKVELAKQKLENLNYEIISIEKDKNFHNWITFKTDEGFKLKCDIYNILKDNFKIDAYLLVGENKYSVENAMIMAHQTNKYNSKILHINKQFANVECGICKEQYKVHIKTFLSSPYKICNKCRSKLHTTKLLDEESVFNDIKENYGFDILSNQHYHGNDKRIGVKDKDGYKGFISYNTIRRNGQVSRFAKYNPYALENIRKYIKDNGMDCEILNQKYNGWGKPLKIKCNCGKIFTASIDHILNDNQIQCRDCTKSKSNNEKIIEVWLKNNNIKYIEQYIYKDCYYKRPLPFDFYLPQFNILIEVDGELHFSDTERFCGMNKEQVKKTIKLQQKRDEIKNKYCKEHNIQLIRISYKQINNNEYKNILSQIIR